MTCEQLVKFLVFEIVLQNQAFRDLSMPSRGWLDALVWFKAASNSVVLQGLSSFRQRFVKTRLLLLNRRYLSRLSRHKLHLMVHDINRQLHLMTDRIAVRCCCKPCLDSSRACICLVRQPGLWGQSSGILLLQKEVQDLPWPFCLAHVPCRVASRSRAQRTLCWCPVVANVFVLKSLYSKLQSHKSSTLSLLWEQDKADLIIYIIGPQTALTMCEIDWYGTLTIWHSEATLAFKARCCRCFLSAFQNLGGSAHYPAATGVSRPPPAVWYSDSKCTFSFWFSLDCLHNPSVSFFWGRFCASIYRVRFCHCDCDDIIWIQTSNTCFVWAFKFTNAKHQEIADTNSARI